MKAHPKFVRYLIAWLIALMASFVHAQYTANYQTNLISGTGSNWDGDYFVGSNYVFDVLQITSGGGLTNANGYVGYASTSSNNTVIVNGSGSLWTNTADIDVGYYGSGNQLFISESGRVVNTSGYVGRNGAKGNLVVVSGVGSIWNNTGVLSVGGQNGSSGNRLIISNGGQVFNASWAAIGNYGSSDNMVLVSDSNSLWKNASDLYIGKENGPVGSRLVISNGGTVVNNATFIGYRSETGNHAVLVTGNGSTWSNAAGLSVGYYGSGNQMIIENGGSVVDESGYVGIQSGANSNSVVVRGSGSIWTNRGSFEMGSRGNDNQLVVSNGGWVVNKYGSVGSWSNRNTVVISDVGSLWNSTGTLDMGKGGSYNQMIISNGGGVWTPMFIVGTTASATGNTVRILSGGVLDANALIVTNASNSITNFGGIFQFSSATPTIATNNGGVGGSIVLTNGTIAFRGIGNAPLLGGTQLTNIIFQGDNGYRLNGATNALVGAYTFSSGTATNYQNLQLVGVNPLWQSTALTIGPGGALIVSNAAGARVNGTITNAGTMTVLNAQAIYNGNVVNQGAYLSDPSTNSFNGNFTVGPTATVVAAAGDVYAFGSNLVLQSTNRAFDMHLAHAVFADTGYGISSGNTNHVLDLTGSGALDKGSNWQSVAQLATNFSIGTLTIAAGNRLTLAGDAGTNALYVGVLDLSAWNTNASSLTNTLEAALGLNVNLYYDRFAPENAYLAGATFDLWGASGLLIPIPEPSSIAAMALGLTLLFVARRRVC